MTIKLRGSTDGSVSLTAPADTSPTGTDITLTLPTDAGSANQFLKNSGTAGTLDYSSMVEDSSGNVGIGTTSPSNLLHISSSSPKIQLTDTSTGADHILDGDSGVGSFWVKVDANAEGSAPAFIVDVAGFERARLDNSGRLLVGTTSAPNTSSTAKIQVIDSGSAGLVLGRNDSSVVADDTLGYIMFMGNDGGSYENCARIRARADGTHASGDKPTYLEFSTTADGASSPTERVKITSDGSFVHHGSVFYVTSPTTTATFPVFAVYTGGSSITSFGTVKCRIHGDGDVENVNNRYTGISDIKLKENIVDAGSQWSDIKSLQVRNFNFKAETTYSTHTQIGLIAQEVESISPGLVSDIPDRDQDGNDLGTVTKSVSYSVLYMKAVKALQEAMTRIETLEAKVAALEAA